MPDLEEHAGVASLTYAVTTLQFRCVLAADPLQDVDYEFWDGGE